MTEVLINGVRYVQAEQVADSVHFWFMHDNHTFTRLYGVTLDKVLAHADTVEASEQGSYGMLCPANLLCGNKDIRCVGPFTFARGSKDPKDQWNIMKMKWRKAMEADADVMRLIKTNVK